MRITPYLYADRTDELVETSRQFRDRSRDAKNAAQWQLYMQYLGGFLVFVIVIIIILAMLGVFDSDDSGSTRRLLSLQY